MESEVVISTVIDPREHAALIETLKQREMECAYLKERLERVTRYSRGGPGITD